LTPRFSAVCGGPLVVRTLLDGGDADQAVRALTAEYAVDADSADRDVRELIGELRSAGLVEEDTGRRERRRWP
jgi:hypothetical protein